VWWLSEMLLTTVQMLMEGQYFEGNCI
jgi:hypothetical protein